MRLYSMMALSMLASVALAKPAADLVDQTALQATYNTSASMNTTTWSGYLDVSENKSLHYMFVESTSPTKDTDPVLIWFNGGPGCSSLLGAFQENGPLTVDSDGNQKFQNNTNPWNTRANLLYLEQPSGVGFSLAKNEKSYNHSDYSQSVDTLKALLLWYDKFPEYVNNSLFISGESYGGIYVPYLTWQVYEHNLKMDVQNDRDTYNNRTANKTNKINLKGFMVGNGVTNWRFDTNPSLPATLGGFDMVPNDWLDLYEQNTCMVDFHGEVSGDDKILCEQLFVNMSASIPDGILNPYDLYRKIPDEEQNPPNNTFADPLNRPGLSLAKTAPWLKWRKDAYKIYQKTANLDSWLNQEDTKKALHTNLPINETHNVSWSDCNGQINQRWTFQMEASQWIYTVLKTSGYIRMMHYSGDTDGVLPTFGTKRWIEDLGWKKHGNYTMWKTGDQVSGFYQKYEGLDFVTVKGVGHMAPQWARPQMQDIMNKWIHQEDMFAPDDPAH